MFMPKEIQWNFNQTTQQQQKTKKYLDFYVKKKNINQKSN